ncbi:protein containing DUF736 [mine drainage metagenome]|uniref:Protein containing DUF736 n=1 Tax=mine drainage metagenome TaxID=410659 RepID=T1D420_9ZZZZ
MFAGQSRIGDAWEARSGGDSPKNYLRVKLDDPAQREPITAALFPSEDGSSAQLIWNPAPAGRRMSACRRCRRHGTGKTAGE